MYLKNYKIKNKQIDFPIFFPDATRAVIKSIDSQDIKASGIEGLVVNAYHLFQEPGISIIKNLDGVKKFMNFNGWITSDSGGFQLLSLIHGNPELGKVDDEGIKIKGMGGKTTKFVFTPEKSIETQFNIGADIMVCLDDCPAKDASQKDLEKSVWRTIEWGERCKQEFNRQIKLRNLTEDERPILLGVIQGGKDKSLRKKCAEGLIKNNFGGYAFGGWPMNEEGKFDYNILKWTCDLMPKNLPKFALGIGSVEGIIEGVKMGYNIFDCVLPTRDARHKRLYVFKRPIFSSLFPPKAVGEEESFWEYLYIDKGKYSEDNQPIEKGCDCWTCQNYSCSYLHHLFAISDALAWRLATIHNLRFYTRLVELLRGNKLS